MFGSTSTVALPLTTDSAAIGRVLASVPTLTTGTHVFNAVSMGLQMLAQAKMTAGALVVLSDGANTGQLSPQAGAQRKAQVISTAVSEQARVYAIGVRDAAFKARTLQNLAAATGGTYTEVASQGLTPLLRELGAELSNEYLIRYRSVAAFGGAVRVEATVTGQPGIGVASYTSPPLPAPVGQPRAHATQTSFWHSTLAAVLACLVAGGLLGLAVLALVSPRRNIRGRIGRFVALASVARKKSWATVLLDRAFPDEDQPREERSKRWATFAENVELSRIGFSPRQIIVATLVTTLLVGWLMIAATGSAIAFAVGLVVPIVVRVAIRVQLDRQRRAFDEQLPENLQVVASAMRAGHTFIGALGVVAEDAPEPSRRELRRVLSDEALGVPLIDALNSVTARMKSSDFEHVALVATLQRETGGNTAEVIDTVTETIRERLELRRLVSALTAQGRLAGIVVSSLPVALLLFISLVNPNYIHPLFHKTAGIIALCVGAVMLGTGALIIRRIVDIKI
jgi:tight adherence protein B